MARIESLAADDDGNLHVRSIIVSSESVSPSNSTQIDFDALWIGGAGALAIEHTLGDGGRTYTNVPAGQFFPVKGVRVLLTGTTATGIIACRFN